MKLQNAEEILSGLTQAQQKRVQNRQKRLLRSKDHRLYDDRMYLTLMELSKDPELVTRTRDQLDEIGFAQSIYDYDQLHSQILRYKEPDYPSFTWCRNFTAAKEKMIQHYKSSFLRQIDYTDDTSVIEALPKSDSHAGWSFIETGLVQKGMYEEGIFSRQLEAEQQAKASHSFNRIILPAYRTQAADPIVEDVIKKMVDKTRLVHILDIVQILAEVRFAKPVQDLMSRENWYAGGKDDDMIGRILRESQSKYGHSFTIDYSKYDQSISSWLIREAFDIIRVMFNEQMFDEELFNVIKNDFIHKVIIDGNCELHEIHKGVPSGSMFTQIVDSIVNKLIVDTYMSSCEVEDYEMMIMGDDNIVFTRIKIDIDHISSYINHNFGITVNSSKISICEGIYSDPEFLSRKWTVEGAWRDERLLIAKMLFPERFRNYRDNKDLAPESILYCYHLTFPVSLNMLFDQHKTYARIPRGQPASEGFKYLTGLMRYRALYLK